MPKKDDHGIDAALYEDLRAQIVVKGAGGQKGKKICGVFTLDPEPHNGRNKYTHKSGKGTIFFDQFWCMSCDENLETYEYKNVTELEAELVPEEWWSCNDPASQPAPHVVDEWLRRWNAVKVFRSLHVNVLAEHKKTVVSMLMDSKDQVRWEAVTTLGRLHGTHLEEVADDVFALIERERKENVREAAIKVIGKLDPEFLVQHAEKILLVMKDESHFVRLWALICYFKLPKHDLHEFELEKMKKDDAYMPIREKAIQMIDQHRRNLGMIQDDD